MAARVDTQKMLNQNHRAGVAPNDDDEESIVQIITSNTQLVRNTIENTDEFSKKAEDIKTLNGLSSTFKRNTSRQMNKVFSGSAGTRSKANERQDVTGYNLFKVVFPPYNLDYLAQIYEKSAPHYAAVKAKVSNIVGLGYDFVESPKTKMAFDSKKDDKGKANFSRRVSGMRLDMLDWLAGCNSEDTFTEVMSKIWTDYEVTGNGYLEIGRTRNGDVQYLGHIPSTTMRIRQDRDGFVQIVDAKAVFFRNFGDKKTADPIGNDTQPNEIIHIKKYSPTSGYYGVPDIVSALQAVAGSEFAARFNLDYFENKAVPRYVIVIKGGKLNSASQREVAEFFEVGLKGKNHRTLVVPLPADEPDKKTSFEMKPIEAGTQDSSFNNYEANNQNKILMAHRVPITKVSVSDLALAVASDADKTFKEQVCQPEQSVFEEKLNKIIKEKTDIFTLSLNELSLTDEETQANIDDTNIKNQTLLPNEARVKRGHAGIPGGDKPFELKPQQTADAKATAGKTRTRDAARKKTAPDTKNTPRNAKGEGRQQS